MGLLARLTPHYYVKQLQRKRDAFGPGGAATLWGTHDYLVGKKATGRVLFGAVDSQGQLIATTARQRSKYQSLGQERAPDAEAMRIANPIIVTVIAIKQAYPKDKDVQEAVETFRRGGVDGYGRLLDTAELRTSLSVLAPLARRMKAEAGVRFDDTPQVRTIPARTKPAMAQVLASPKAAQSESAPDDISQHSIEESIQVSMADSIEDSPVPKLGLRAMVASSPAKGVRTVVEDAYALLETYLATPERLQDPVRTLLEVAHAHCASRSSDSPVVWNLEKAESIDEGFEILLKTPVLPMLAKAVPQAFNDLCRAYDALHD